MPGSQSYEDLLGLLSCSSKRDAKRLAGTLMLSSSAFDELITSAASLGYVHQPCVRDMVPAHLASGLAVLASGNPSKLATRLPQMFKDRRRLVGHLFHTLDGTVWHLFYFDQRDMGHTRPANWKRGPHVHYLSHLWPEHSMQSIVDEFNSAKPHLNGAEHIGYVDDDWPGI